MARASARRRPGFTASQALIQSSLKTHLHGRFLECELHKGVANATHIREGQTYGSHTHTARLGWHGAPARGSRARESVRAASRRYRAGRRYTRLHAPFLPALLPLIVSQPGRSYSRAVERLYSYTDRVPDPGRHVCRHPRSNAFGMRDLPALVAQSKPTPFCAPIFAGRGAGSASALRLPLSCVLTDYAHAFCRRRGRSLLRAHRIGACRADRRGHPGRA